ncbi:MAG: cobalamin-dependent protein [Spirochaetaceae bacterium]
MKTLLITPPFSQLNTPYPATCYLAGYLRSKDYNIDQKDLGIIVINRIFSKKGLIRIFNEKSVGRIGAIKDSYINTIDPVIKFLQGNDPTLAHRIVKTDYLPQSDRFDNLDTENFGDMGINNLARHMATLYMNDIGDYITVNIDNNFGFSRYSERLGLSPGSFESVENELLNCKNLITDFILEEWDKILKNNYDVIGITIPFPGNLISALLIADRAKKLNPKVKIIIGGGWVNTELRDLTETKLFNYVDYVVLDDGEDPLDLILKSILHKDSYIKLNRTYILEDNKVTYKTDNQAVDIHLNNLPAPDYTGLDLSLYISLLDTLNPMHSLWNSGRWNKMTLAHGCYWKRCAFCDTTLPYIAEFHQSTASILVDKIEKIIKDTGESGFHFVDEAAPPALLKELSLELIRRGVTITWWTNIRFENRFNPGIAKIIAKAGCIGVSGGVEVASDRLLKLMDKGVTVDQVAKVTGDLGLEGIMVHAYLMYGFPTQTAQETIDALEVVRQLFKLGLIQSAYWHQFALTAHSSVGHNPGDFNIKITEKKFEGFARNDLEFSSGMEDPNRYSVGLKTSLYNYMAGKGLDQPLSIWFKSKVPKTKIKKNYIETLLEGKELELKNTTEIIWLGPEVDIKENILYLYDNVAQEKIELTISESTFIKELTSMASYNNPEKLTLADMDIIAEKYKIDPDLWLSQESANLLYSYGLILI